MATPTIYDVIRARVQGRPHALIWSLIKNLCWQRIAARIGEGPAKSVLWRYADYGQLAKNDVLQRLETVYRYYD